jgi:hypothetical protein
LKNLICAIIRGLSICLIDGVIDLGACAMVPATIRFDKKIIKKEDYGESKATRR